MKSKSNYIPPETMKLMIETIPQLKIRKWKDYDIAMLFMICYWCNLRIMEAIPREAEDFDLVHNEVYLAKTKNGKEEYAVIPPSFIPELGQWLEGKQGKLFPGLNYSIVYFWMKKLGEILDIKALKTNTKITGEKTVTHIFRKSYSKDLLYGNVGDKAPINVISKSLRHKGKNPIASTYQYLKLDNEDVKDWYSQQKES